jgi:hypothetical protein
MFIFSFFLQKTYAHVNSQIRKRKKGERLSLIPKFYTTAGQVLMASRLKFYCQGHVKRGARSAIFVVLCLTPRLLQLISHNGTCTNLRKNVLVSPWNHAEIDIKVLMTKFGKSGKLDHLVSHSELSDFDRFRTRTGHELYLKI